MGIINFICDVIRKIVIFFLCIIALVLLSIYVLNYPALNDPNNVMLWIIVIPLFFISMLVKKK